MANSISFKVINLEKKAQLQITPWCFLSPIFYGAKSVLKGSLKVILDHILIWF